MSDPNEIILVEEPISAQRVREAAAAGFGDMIKAVVDTKLRLMAVAGDLHADEESILLQRGSEQANLWGINIYPDKSRSEWIEFDSMINIRPRQNNRSRYVEDAETRRLICEIVNLLII